MANVIKVFQDIKFQRERIFLISLMLNYHD